MSEFVSKYTGSEKEESVVRRLVVGKFENLDTSVNGIATLDFRSIGSVVVVNVWADQSMLVLIPFSSGGGSNYRLGNTFWQVKVLAAATMEAVASTTLNVYAAYYKVNGN